MIEKTGRSLYIGAVSFAESKQMHKKETTMQRVFRACVFQYAVGGGILEAIVRFFYSLFTGRVCCMSSIDPAREERSLNVLKQLGGADFLLKTPDGGAEICGLTLKAADLEMKIKSYGASWQKIGLPDKRTIFAIVPPQDYTHWSTWTFFYSNTLCKMGWKTETILYAGKHQEVLVTCENADLVDTTKKYCFLDCHPNGRSFLHDRRRAGVFLGMRQDVCLFDQRGLPKSPGRPGEGAHYLDAMTVFEHLQTKAFYQPNQIWVMGKCGGVAVAAYLKRHFHDRGVNFVEENGFLSLQRDIVDDQPPFFRWLARRQMGALSSGEIPEALRPHEDHFDTEAKLTGLNLSNEGHFVAVHPEHERGKAASPASRFEALAKKANAKAAALFYPTKGKGDSRTENPFDNPPFRRTFTAHLFSTTGNV
jgi:hypothetical protein